MEIHYDCMGRRRKIDPEPMTTIAVPDRILDFLDRHKRSGETRSGTVTRFLTEAANKHREMEKMNKVIKAYHSYWKQIYEEKKDTHDWNQKQPNRIKILKWFINELQTTPYENIPEHASAFKENTSICEEEINRTIRQLYDHIQNMMDMMDDENFPYSHLLNEGVAHEDWITVDEIYCFLYHYTNSKKFFVRETPDSYLSVVDLFAMRKKSLGPLDMF